MTVYWYSVILIYQDTGIPGTLVYQSTSIPVYWYTGIAVYQYIGRPGYQVALYTGIPGYQYNVISWGSSADHHGDLMRITRATHGRSGVHLRSI